MVQRNVQRRIVASSLDLECAALCIVVFTRFRSSVKTERGCNCLCILELPSGQPKALRGFEGETFRFRLNRAVSNPPDNFLLGCARSHQVRAEGMGRFYDMLGLPRQRRTARTDLDLLARQ